MKTITASVEEVTLSETSTPDEKPTNEGKPPTKKFEDQGLLFSPPAVLPELSARRALDIEVPKVLEGKEKYAASLHKERRRKYLIKYRSKGLDFLSARGGWRTVCFSGRCFPETCS